MAILGRARPWLVQAADRHTVPHRPATSRGPFVPSSTRSARRRPEHPAQRPPRPPPAPEPPEPPVGTSRREFADTRPLHAPRPSLAARTHQRPSNGPSRTPASRPASTLRSAPVPELRDRGPVPRPSDRRDEGSPAPNGTSDDRSPALNGRTDGRSPGTERHDRRPVPRHGWTTGPRSRGDRGSGHVSTGGTSGRPSSAQFEEGR